MAVAEPAPGLDEVLRLVFERTGLDLRLYRQASIERRVTSRFQKVGCQSYLEYAEYLRANPAEVGPLVKHVTIKVSRFFRNAEVFSRLRDEVVPELLRGVDSTRGLRLWSAGCGEGEEPYSLAILLEEAARERQLPPAAIYASDVDEGALAFARQAVYPESALAELPPELAARYFTCRPERFGIVCELAAPLRERVRFRHGDLLAATEGPDGLAFDLILCRNVLIYLETEAQQRVFDLLVASLLPGGYLCLGEAELLPASFRQHFEAIDQRARLYRKARSAPTGGM